VSPLEGVRSALADLEEQIAATSPQTSAPILGDVLGLDYIEHRIRKLTEELRRASSGPPPLHTI
jgi:hypothetical protein